MMETTETPQMSPAEIANIQNYFSALTQAYGVLHPPKRQKAKLPTQSEIAQAQQAMGAPPTGDDRKQLIYDIKLHILALETEAANARPRTRDEKRRLRKIETKLELYRVRLEKLEVGPTS
jgi:hypothetical protein